MVLISEETAVKIGDRRASGRFTGTLGHVDVVQVRPKLLEASSLDRYRLPVGDIKDLLAELGYIRRNLDQRSRYFSS
jgi:hypothetical protein